MEVLGFMSGAGPLVKRYMISATQTTAGVPIKAHDVEATDIGGKSYAIGRRIFVSERNGDTLIGAKKAKAVVEDLSGPATVRTSGKPKAAKAAKEK